MKKNFLFLILLLAAAFFPLRVQAAAGYLYESDISTGSIFQFTTTASGTLLKTTLATGLTGLRGIAFDHAGNLFAAQNDRIVRITPTGFTSVFASGMHGPNFLAVDRAGNLFASDRDGNILRYTPQGVGKVFAKGLNKPTGLAFDFAGNLFVADFAENAIFKFTPAGAKSTFAFGLNGPQGLTFDRFGNLYVANSGSGTVEAFTPVGSRFTVVLKITSPVSLAFDSRPRTTNNVNTRDDLYVAQNCNGTSTGTGSIQKFTAGSETGAVFASNVGCPLQLVFEPPRDPLFNISTRARVEPLPYRELIGGFIITGTERKRVLIRGIGPSLAKSGIAQPLLDPSLELHTPSGVTFNDNWMDSQKAEIEATGAAPKAEHESAIIASLDPGNYTAILRGTVFFQEGVASVEIYDLDVGADSTLANLSSRAYVQTGDDRMIAGLIVGGGNGMGEVLIRALGPSLKQAGLTETLADPTLSLRDANGAQLLFNDDWGESQGTEIYATGIPPESSLESAIVTTLNTGAYTAIVQGFNGGSGVALVEVYNLR